jgi:hypothetical protein
MRATNKTAVNDLGLSLGHNVIECIISDAPPNHILEGLSVLLGDDWGRAGGMLEANGLLHGRIETSEYSNPKNTCNGFKGRGKGKGKHEKERVSTSNKLSDGLSALETYKRER